jgi:precorrin-6B methylase 2
MNKNSLEKEVQDYINSHLNADVSKIALSKSPFSEVSSAELANQIAAKKKAEKKLPTWFKQESIYYPSTLSIEQTSSEDTAAYKSQLVKGSCLIDVTAGFGVDSFYFSHQLDEVYSCEINEKLSEISAHNAKLLGRKNIQCLAVDGLEYIAKSEKQFGTIYVDPARRSTSGKVFKLTDCTPNVVEHLDVLLSKTERIIIKTSPLLDLQAGLAELKHVSEIHIVSVKNECKELLWVIDSDFSGTTQVVCTALNTELKNVALPIRDEQTTHYVEKTPTSGFLYEADAALMKSGAFNAIANQFGLQKLDKQSHLYFSVAFKPSFIGRIFELQAVFAPNELKKGKDLQGNVIVRNFPERAENLVKKLKIKPNTETFYIFTQVQQEYVAFKTKILQYY